jgi:short-subunit dehydrogenase
MNLLKKQMYLRDLKGQRIILTGATSGIGWYVATRLIAEGARVIVSGRRAERLRNLKLSLGNSVNLVTVQGDLCDERHREKLVDVAAQSWGGLDILINNAGVGAVGPFSGSTPQRLRHVFELDFFATAELTRLSIGWLKQSQRPVICNVTSVLAYRGVPLKSEYCAAKFAVRGWSESLRVELLRDGIRVVMVAPSTTRSEFFSALIDSDQSAAGSGFWAQSAHCVARRVCQSLKTGRSESILTAGGRLLANFSFWWPWATDRVLNRFAQ